MSGEQEYMPKWGHFFFRLGIIITYMSIPSTDIHVIVHWLQYSTNYHGLAKERGWVDHLKSPQKKGVGALLDVSTFNHKRHPCMLTATHCPQICWSIGQTITYNEAARLGSSCSVSTKHFEWQNATVGMVSLVSAATLAGYDARPPFGKA